MRVLVLWADDSSPNLGVRTLGRGTAELVRGVWPGADVEFHNYGHRARQVPHGRIRSLLRERVASRTGMLRWLSSFDLVVDTRSGDSFSDIYGLHRLAVMCLVAEFASQVGVPVVLGPQTIGPFGTRRGAVMASRSLRRAALAIARDPTSAAEADRLGAGAIRSTDVVFALPVPNVAKSRDVVLNVSGLLWGVNDHIDAGAYRGTVVALLERLAADDRRVTLLAHVLDSPSSDNDVAAMREVARAAPDAEVVIPEGVDEVRDVVASAVVVVGSRMHACLNALSVGTPAVPLAYSRKFEPLFTDLGWSHTVDLRTGGDAADNVMREIGIVGDRLATATVVERARNRLAHASAALASVVPG